MTTLTSRKISCWLIKSVCTLAITSFSIESMTAQVTPAPLVNGKIVFTRGNSNGSNPEIYVMDPDGSNQLNLTNNPIGVRRRGTDYGDFTPVWSPDGAKIVFASQRSPDSLNEHIYVMNADGSNQIRLTSNDRNRCFPCFGFELRPSWSPDGSKIVFARNGLQIYVMDADGSNQIALTNNPPLRDEAPAWSPDGTRIAFMRYSALHASEIYVMNADGSNQIQLTNTPGSQNGDPAWSPDGTKIAFDRETVTGGIGTIAIHVMNADGSNQIALSSGAGCYGPEWSPDGTKIVSTRNNLIFVMDADGSNEMFLANGRTPRWQRLPAPSP